MMVGGQQQSDSEPILLESNQNHATIQTNGISTALPASMGMGGGYVPMVLYDAFQHHGYRKGDTCGTLTANQNDGIRGDTPLVCYSQNAYGKYTESPNTATLKQSGGDHGGGSEALVIQ